MPAIGVPTPRVDGRAKVTGAAKFAGDFAYPNLAHARLITSAIAKGKIRRFDLTAARATPGFLDILTYENTASQLKKEPSFIGEATPTLNSAEIVHEGQIIAVVIAETIESAREAANKVRVEYDEQPPSATFGSAGIVEKAVKDVNPRHEDPEVGDAEAAFARAPVKIEARYYTPTQHHNTMELFTTTCVWAGNKLTVHEPTSMVGNGRMYIAQTFGIAPADVRVVSPYTGGSFGGKASCSVRTALIAIAAKRLNRPVRLVASRDQGFTIGTYRAETRQHVKLAADRSGKLTALVHDGEEVTSRPSPYSVNGPETTALMYACPNIATKVSVVHADRNTPGFMRAPAELPYMFGLECAMDELAEALQIDPIQLRKINDAQKESVHGKPYTSRSLVQCYDAAAKAFGWERRNPKPRSMRDGDWLIGYGCATACYPSRIGSAAARITLTPDGRARVQMAFTEIGTGAYTVLAVTAAEVLSIPVDHVTVEMGDSDLPPGALAVGSIGSASACNAVAVACQQVRTKLAEASCAAGGGLAGAQPAAVKLENGALRAPDGRSETLQACLARTGVVEVMHTSLPPGGPPNGAQLMAMGIPVFGSLPDHVAYSFGAVLIEARVHSRTGEVRVPRQTGAFAFGTILNPTTARSQLSGGMIWGVSSALHEATEVDPRTARYLNDNFADYLIPVNADIGPIEVILIPEEDKIVNPLGIKGVGELGCVGGNAALANAVYNATGVRVRDLPIRLEKLLTQV